MSRPAGNELCFTLSVTDERDLVEDRLRRIERIYPTARLVLIPDGREAAGHVWPTGPGVVVRASMTPQYAVGSGGRVVQTHLESFLETDARWWFKVDPDSVLHRGFRELPDGICFFGTLQGGNPGPSLQGGCIGGTRAAAELLAESGLLLSPALRAPEQSWARGNPILLERAHRGLVSFDFVHAWACRELGITLVEHPEIRSEWKQPPADSDRYALTHPHKTLDEAAERRLQAGRRRVAARLVELIRSSVPANAIVAVVSKGDASLTETGTRATRHFPADDDGGWAGYHPADSAHAIRLLDAARAQGVDHLALPETSEWWLDYYDGLARHLSSTSRLVAHGAGAGRIWALRSDS
jgi:hypothetical protein